MGFGERSQSVESRHKSINLPSAGAGEEDRHFLLIRQLIAEEYPSDSKRVGATNPLTHL